MKHNLYVGTLAVGVGIVCLGTANYTLGVVNMVLGILNLRVYNQSEEKWVINLKI